MKLLKIIGLAVLAGGGFVGGVIWRDSAAPRGGAKSEERKPLYWVDPMHPAYKSDKPGIAPDCGMQLVPVYEEPAAKAGEHEHGEHDHSAMAGMTETAPMAEGTVQISPERQQLINVQFGTVELASAAQTIRAVGRVAVDETRIHHVHTRVEGYVEKVYAGFTGKFVKRGDPLLTIYSPEMLATQQELLLAIKGRDQLHSSTLDTVPAQMASLIEASKHRLARWEFSAGQIEEVIRTGTPIRNYTLFAGEDGYITARNAFPRQQVTPAMDLYTLVDLSRVWIIADIFEGDAAAIRMGAPAVITAAYDRAISLRGTVSYIQPEFDAQSRTLKVRIEVPNPGLRLKPDMFVDADFRLATGPRLVVPQDAVLDTGERKTVFVDRGEGNFEPREVETGEHIDGRIAILKGLKQGERIVTSGVFLIDSESRLRTGHSHD
ncbi:MAG: efflux RND transporter periplasmic adaptor subunit [Bryobacterales bacterium]|nr:efflux RND transporter periplasmic adaptor subunit [Bryobacterales bacterium]